ncbi:ATP-binding protein [Candidatus Omnitrophota bacterium]
MEKDIFFDRKDFQEILEKRVKGLMEGYRRNIAFIGDELVGKTSIIFNFLNRFRDNRIISVYLEIRPESFASFARRFIGVLLYNFLINSGVELKEDLDYLIARSEGHIPKTCERIKEILLGLKRRKRDNVFTELLSLTDTLYLETGKFSLVIFDEFHNLENLQIKSLFREWSKVLVVQKNTMYLIASSMKFKAKAILSKNLSLLFGNFETISVEPFDIRTSEEYLRCVLKGATFSEGLKNFMINFTGGYPFYLKVVSEALSNPNQKSLADILEGLLFEPSGILNQRFSNSMKRFMDTPCSQDYISILYLIASGHNRLKDIAHIMRRTKKDLSKRINYLLEVDVLTRSGDFLKVSDRVFGYWLKFVYQEKLQSLTFDAINQKNQFINNIENMIQEFTRDAQKPVNERTMDLLRLFDDDMIQMHDKKMRLDHFREIKPLEFKRSGIRDGLLGRSDESLWIMVFKYDLLTEDDVADFAKECRKYRRKLQRKIVIALHDVDDNARLRAFEEKILTWDINNLNQVLDLFSKPRVIV